MVSFLFMIKSHLFNSNSRRLLRILKILVPGWFVAEVSEAQTVGVVQNIKLEILVALFDA